MDVIAYRKIYLAENWGLNRFNMVRHNAVRRAYGTNHPLVLSGQAFWHTDNELCLGYELETNPDIFRPIFSHKRQRLLDGVHSQIVNPTQFWNRVKRRYYFAISRITKLPLECVICIVNYIY